MFGNKRFTSPLFRLSVFSLFIFALLPSVASCNEILDELVADYRAYGLPRPSDRAELSRLKWSTGTVNGVPQYRQVFAFVETDSQDNETYYWVGCHKVKLSDRFSVTPMLPKAASLAEMEPMDSIGQ